MKIAFVSGNRELLPDAVIPLGLLYVMSSTPDQHEKCLIDLCFEPDSYATLRKALIDSKPDLVAIGMRNIQNNDYSGISDNLNYYAELIQITKDTCNAPVVLGGSGFSVMPEALMERLKPDFGISGEGEEAFTKLVTALDNDGLGMDAIGALYHWNGNTVVSNPHPPMFLDLTTLPMPDRNLVKSFYYEEYGIDSVQTKRGCPLRCEYCTYPTIEGRKSRVRKPSSIIDEMFAALETQPAIKHFFIVDSVFNLPKSHAKEVCRELIRRNWSVPWSCYANPLGFDLEFAELAFEAGCAGMEIGSDSGCNHVLDRLRKGFTTDHIRKLRNICESSGIRDCHTFILGTEGETMADVEQTIDFIVDLDPFSAILMIWVDDYETLDPALRSERVALRAEIEKLLLAHKNDYPQWSIPALNINFDEDMFKRLRHAGLHGPLWQHVRGPIQQRPRASRQ